MGFVVRNATLADGRRRDVRVADGAIDAVGSDLVAEHVVPADGNLLLPGMVDVHVHFRQPGAPHKETWASGSRSAAAGGVTTVVDQPNTDPATVDGAAFDRKAALAADSLVNFGLNGGVTPGWDPSELFDRPLLALGEIFLADSTGEMGIGPDLFAEAASAAAAAGVPLTVHAEDASLFDDTVRPDDGADGPTGAAADADAWSAYRRPEAEVAAVETAVEVVADAGGRGHVAHASTPDGIDAANAGGLTCEVTPHHLFLSREDLADLGTYGRMNPPLRDEDRRRAVFERTVDPDGPVDVVATDHAPHTRAEKETTLWDAPSGVPGVETALPLLLAAAARGEVEVERVRDLVARNPAAIFDLPGKGTVDPGADADLVLVDLDETRTIRGEDLHSACEWTPFAGREGVFPRWTTVRGRVAYAAPDAALPAALAPGGRFGEPLGRNVRA
ncbi:MAG: dihydroorotase [Halobacteriaceae archaeon]